MTLEDMIKRSQVVDLKRITYIKCTDSHLNEIFDPDFPTPFCGEAGGRSCGNRCDYRVCPRQDICEVGCHTSAT